MRYLKRACTRRVLLPGFVLLLLIGMGAVLARGYLRPDGRGNVAPLLIENSGELPDPVRFFGWRLDRNLWLTPDAIWITVWEDPSAAQAGARRGVHLRLTFPGANPHPRLEPFQRQAAHVSYLAGEDEAAWNVALPVWSGVRYVDLYPGLDLEIGGEQPCGWRLVARDAEQHWPLTAVTLQVEGAAALAVGGGEDNPYLSITTEVGPFALPLLQAVDAGGSPLPDELQAPLQVQGDVVSAPLSRAGGAPEGLDLLCGVFGGQECRQQAGRRVSGYVDLRAPTAPGVFDGDGEAGDRFAARMDEDCGLAEAVFAAGSGAAWPVLPSEAAAGTAAPGARVVDPTRAARTATSAALQPAAAATVFGSPAAPATWATYDPSWPTPVDYDDWLSDDIPWPTDEVWPTESYPDLDGDGYVDPYPAMTATPTETLIPTTTPTLTLVPTATDVPTATVAPTPTPTRTATATATIPPTATATPSPTATSTVEATGTAPPTETATTGAEQPAELPSPG